MILLLVLAAIILLGIVFWAGFVLGYFFKEREVQRIMQSIDLYGGPKYDNRSV